MSIVHWLFANRFIENIENVTEFPHVFQLCPYDLNPVAIFFLGAAGLRLMERCALDAILAGQFFTCARSCGGERWGGWDVLLNEALGVCDL